VCGINSNCRVNMHSAVCVCIPGYTGDPFSACSPIPISKLFNSRNFYIIFTTFYILGYLVKFIILFHSFIYPYLHYINACKYYSKYKFISFVCIFIKVHVAYTYFFQYFLSIII
jgi:hypothetical protein